MEEEIRDHERVWTAPDRATLVLRILRGEISIDEAARECELPVSEIDAWKDEFLATAEEALRLRPTDRTSPEPTATTRARGVWICKEGRESLAPCLLIEAACPGRSPGVTVARWVGRGDPPKEFTRSGGLSLLHGEYERGLPGGEHLHLFANKMGATARFERDTDLGDWELPVGVAAVILLLEEQAQEGLVERLISRFVPKEERTFTWARRQAVPLVVGALGFPPERSLGDRLRRRYGLQPDVPVVAGESPRRRRLQASVGSGAATSALRGSTANLLGMGDMSFDPEYAAQLLHVAWTEICREGEADPLLPRGGKRRA